MPSKMVSNSGPQEHFVYFQIPIFATILVRVLSFLVITPLFMYIKTSGLALFTTVNFASFGLWTFLSVLAALELESCLEIPALMSDFPLLELSWKQFAPPMAIVQPWLHIRITWGTWKKKLMSKLQRQQIKSDSLERRPLYSVVLEILHIIPMYS